MTLSPQANRVLHYLAAWKGPDWPKVHETALALDLTELEVLRAIRELADKGLIEPATN